MKLFYICLLATLACLFSMTALFPLPTGVMLHIILSFFATALLIVASAQALLMGCQHYFLKHPRMKLWLPFLPPLQTMETLLFNLLIGGTLLFTASLMSGFFFENHEAKALLRPKIFLAIGAWCVLGFLLIGRKRFGWRGTTAIRLTLSATVLVLLLLLL
jgi:ABC-type uncharacterized transport system permease subunit